MNDFTKEELDYMHSSIYFNEREHHLEKDIPEQATHLMNKIQSMIDNYCEHESEGDWHICVDKCKKCGAICSD